VLPALALTETVEATALGSSDKPGVPDPLTLSVYSPHTTPGVEGSGPKLNLTEDPSTGEEEGGEPENDNGSIEALTKELKGQRWDADKSAWK
jgi:hypothetical protein